MKRRTCFGVILLLLTTLTCPLEVFQKQTGTRLKQPLSLEQKLQDPVQRFSISAGGCC